MEVILGIIAALAIIRLWQKNQEAKRDLEETRTFLLACNRKLDEERTRTAALSAAAEDLILAKKRIGELSRYEPIEDVDKAITEKRNALAAEKAQMVAELEKSKTAFLQQQSNAEQEAAATRNALNQEMIAARQEREAILLASTSEAATIVKKAQERAEEIAGTAYAALQQEQQLTKVILALKNQVQGYGDEYIVPTFSLLDELAAEYDFKKAGQELKSVRDRIRMMVKNDVAATCKYVEPARRRYAVHFVLDAFNGKVDSILSRVRHDNYGKLKQQILDAFHLVNHNGAAFRDARITLEYLDARVEELKWAVAVHELKQQDIEEQRRIKQEMQEELRAKKEYEKAVAEAEKEEKLLQKSMEQARKALESANESQKAQYEMQLRELEEKLAAAEEKQQRAISMAQQTRQGHVYVISNEGSFGENILKIGLTRRLEPMDRVRELGDASVPFPFDVHALMFSEDAPALERDLHQKFRDYQVNRVNPKKEFFDVPVSEVKKVTRELGIDTRWTMLAEAQEFRESKAICGRPRTAGAQQGAGQ